MDGARLLVARSGTACRAPIGEKARTKNVVAVAPSICGCAMCYLRRRLKPTLLKGKPVGLESAAMSDGLQESVPVVVLNRALFGVGLLLYVLSFFLVATRDSKGGLFGRLVGYECAYLAPEYVIAGTPFSHGDAYRATAPVSRDSCGRAYQSGLPRLCDARVPRAKTASDERAEICPGSDDSLFLAGITLLRIVSA